MIGREAVRKQRKLLLVTSASNLTDRAVDDVRVGERRHSIARARREEITVRAEVREPVDSPRTRHSIANRNCGCLAASKMRIWAFI